MGDKRDTMITGDAISTRAGEATFLGHPKGLLPRLMMALVVLYMVNQLLLPGHVEHIGAPFVLGWIGRSAARC